MNSNSITQIEFESKKLHEEELAKDGSNNVEEHSLLIGSNFSSVQHDESGLDGALTLESLDKPSQNQVDDIVILKKFECIICKKRWKRKNDLARHVHTHFKVKKREPIQHVCDHCGRIFSKKDEWRAHFLSHTGQPQFKCEVCGKEFIYRASIHQHRLVHTKERPHKCFFCDAAFGRLPDLRIHILTHTKEKPHVCPICSAGFTTIGNLNSHMVTHTKERPFPCEICKRKYARRSDLKRHLQSHLSEPLDSVEAVIETPPSGASEKVEVKEGKKQIC